MVVGVVVVVVAVVVVFVRVWVGVVVTALPPEELGFGSGIVIAGSGTWTIAATAARGSSSLRCSSTLGSEEMPSSACRPWTIDSGSSPAPGVST